MAQKRKNNQSKLGSAAALLQKLEQKTARDAKALLGDNWRDNLFEIMMTRLELAAPYKKTFSQLPAELCREPKEIPAFAKAFFKTMHNILKLAKAPAHPQHVVAFSVLYASVVDVFLKDTTKDHAKTMAALDKRLGLFEQFVGYTSCNKIK